MDRYKVSVFQFAWYEGSRILECYAFSVNPLESLEEVVSWINSLESKPDFIQISYVNGGCLFDNEDTRIVNNIFYCNKH